jgi:hypothetical protein
MAEDSGGRALSVTATPRAGLPQWGTEEDPVSREQFQDAFADIDELMAIDLQGLAADRPPAGVRGRYYFAQDTAILSRDTGAAWVNIGARLRIPQSWAIPGVLIAGLIPGLFVPGFGQTATLVAVRHKLLSGTSATINVRRNDVAIPGAGTGINVTTAAATTVLNTVLTADDFINLSITAVSGNANGLTMTAYIDYTS